MTTDDDTLDAVLATFAARQPDWAAALRTGALNLGHYMILASCWVTAEEPLAPEAWWQLLAASPRHKGAYDKALAACTSNAAARISSEALTALYDLPEIERRLTDYLAVHPSSALDLAFEFEPGKLGKILTGVGADLLLDEGDPSFEGWRALLDGTPFGDLFAEEWQQAITRASRDMAREVAGEVYLERLAVEVAERDMSRDGEDTAGELPEPGGVAP